MTSHDVRTTIVVLLCVGGVALISYLVRAILQCLYPQRQARWSQHAVELALAESDTSDTPMAAEAPDVATPEPAPHVFRGSRRVE